MFGLSSRFLKAVEKDKLSKTDRDPATAGFPKFNKPCPYEKNSPENDFFNSP